MRVTGDFSTSSDEDGRRFRGASAHGPRAQAEPSRADALFAPGAPAAAASTPTGPAP